jgi:ubiquinone/menaquinone biosynthesis C-methylase UbiE
MSRPEGRNGPVGLNFVSDPLLPSASPEPKVMVLPKNPYTRMQKSQYERDADLMNQENHMFHNANRDYWDILVSDTESNFRGKVGLDFGCGCGRNVMNLWMRFARMDGVDISRGNLQHARENLLKCGCPPECFRLFESNGVDLSCLPADEYDFIMSTIVLQHISVHDIRFGLLKEFYRVMKAGGLLSFQMGFGEGYGRAGYFDNHYDAKVTNSDHDTSVTDPEQIAGELRQIGFSNVRHVIRKPFSDGHPNWIFVKAEKPGTAATRPASKAAVASLPIVPVVAPRLNGHSPAIAVFAEQANLGELAALKVTYQMAQFVHLAKHARLLWRNAPGWSNADSISTLERGLGARLDAAIVFDETALLTDEHLQRLRWDTDLLLVYVAHDFWCHPLRVAEKLRQHKRVLMVLRHECARQLFDRLLPGVPKVIQRPGVETSIFHPRAGRKEYDVLLGGSETPDYPLRQRLNRLVRENTRRLGWKMLDLTGAGTMSNPPGSQQEYSAALAASKVSPTGSNRGGSHGCKLVTQYLDLSAARAQCDDAFYGLKTPEVTVENWDTAGITPRYLESLASKSLLIADLPSHDRQEWYRDKMAVISHEASDAELVATIDRWVRDDEGREIICERAWQAVQSGETSEHRAAELLQLIKAHL